MLNLIIPVIFFIFLNGSVSVVSKEKFGTTLPFTFIFTSLIIYISQCVFGTFNLGFILLVILAIGFIPLSYVYSKRGDVDSVFMHKSILSNGLIAYLIIVCLFSILDYGAVLVKWDELSHWGVMIKEMLRLDSFYSVDASTLTWHKEYPPIIQCFELLWVKLCGEYSVTALRISIHVLTIVLPTVWVIDNMHILRIGEDDRKDKGIRFNCVLTSVLLVMLIVLIMNSIDGENVLMTIYQDFCYPMFYVYAMILIFTGRVWKSGFAAVSLVTAIAGLIMTKQMGIAFYGILIWTLIGSYLIEKENKNLKSVMVMALSIVLPLLFYMSWKVYTDRLGLVGQFDLGNITISRVMSDITGNGSEEAFEICKIYIDYIFHRSIFIGYVSITYFGVFVFTIVILALLGLLFRNDSKRLILLGTSCIVGTLGYAFTMMVLYMYCYPSEEPAVCYDRYMGAYVISEVILLLLVLILEFADLNVYGKIRFNIVALSFMVILIIALSDKEHLNNLSPAFMNDTDDADKYAAFAEELDQYTDAGSTILIIDNKQGYRRNYIHYYLNDIYIDDRYPNIYDEDITDETYADTFVNDLLDDDYLYMVNINDDLKEVLGQYTDSGKLKSKGIYSISNVDGRLYLEKLN